MTKEEQFDWLYRLRSTISVYMPKEWLIPMSNALDMTIKSLEQEPKTGRWNDIPKYKDIAWRCSECEHFAAMKHNYCPCCGCRMVEPQESEG